MFCLIKNFKECGKVSRQQTNFFNALTNKALEFVLKIKFFSPEYCFHMFLLQLNLFLVINLKIRNVFKQTNGLCEERKDLDQEKG